MRELRQHMSSLIWTRSDMSISEAKAWLVLINSADTLKIARYYGFTWIRSVADREATSDVLRRFIRITRDSYTAL